jgi:ABC-2 type transport system permease protein
MDKAKSTQVPIYDSDRQGSPALDEFWAILKYRYLIVQFVRRDILTRYKRSALGVAWTMLNPLGTMLILTLVFSRAFGGSQEGYAAYVLSGLIAWNFFAQSTTASTLHLVWGGSLLKKIYIPRTSFAISATGTGLINLLLSIIPLVIVMLIIQVPIRWTVIFLPIPIVFLSMFALGVGLFISGMAMFYADVAEMFQITLTAWMYLTPVIWSPEVLPELYGLWITQLNPMFYLVELFRMPIYYGQVPDLSLVLISGGIAIITLFAGWMFFTSKSDEFAYRV